VARWSTKLKRGAGIRNSASVEEKNLGATFPTTYSAYRARTKMLMPRVL
jgi:protein-S-isoprenylcysteine O-methyltransferase Ste14